MSFDDDMRYARARAQAHGFDFQAGNRRHWQGPGRGYGEAHDENGTRGPTPLEIALVRKLGNRVTLVSRDFERIRDFTVHRTEEPDGSVTLEVRDKRDPRNMTLDLVRQPGGGYAVDPYAGL